MTHLTSRSGNRYDLPIFFPVYHPVESPVPMALWTSELQVKGCIVNAFFLYKDRQVRKQLMEGMDIHDYIGFHGLVMTDSGAFQGFQGSLYLKNKTIVAFQENIGSDIVSPLDLVSPPGEKRTVAQKKWRRTLIRIQEAQGLVQEATLAGVQQGGRFHDLRRQCTEDLLKLDIHYLALGSLVPFFNRNHDLEFVGRVIRDAREMCGRQMPIHVYGAGDPVELPFFAAMGANVFDSSSYAHYANQGWYMTPFGAINDPGPLVAGEFTCPCQFCAQFSSREAIFQDTAALATHNLWTILHCMEQIRQALAKDTLSNMLEMILQQHHAWFPESRLAPSWEKIQ